MTEQLDLFAIDTPAPAPAESQPCPAPRPRRRRRQSTPGPEVITQVLTETTTGRFGLLDDSERVVVFEEPDRVRLASEEDLVTDLMASGHLERHPRRDTVSALHGAIRRPVTPIRPTRAGRGLLARWSALHPQPKGQQ